ncbi:hypothetical protein MWU60_14220 [Yoonia sp. F2084L]|uniref:hypothetical protein n=1 Tax=Yoonia sp. F2084L TaxID=2926419 RepID=UPI001FF13CD5|nr:hypothetical protein [Yoonia sp. F2084L]MCK0096733.1 hypothetical protein [Yoonia sp. F2084L]
MAMSHLKLIMPVTALGFTLLATPATAQQLTGQQFIDSHAGKCLTYTGPTNGTQCYNADGTTSYDDAIYGTDTGEWSVRGDDICVRYTKEPALDCGPVTSVGGGSYTDGSYTWTLN